jgi:hypothetical protein
MINYLQLPIVYGQRGALARWRALLNLEAPRRTVRIGMHGDSRSTCPQGGGTQFINFLNLLFAQRYNNIPETQLLPPAVYGSSAAADPEAWLAFGNNLGGVASGLAANLLPPGVQSFKYINTDNGSLHVFDWTGRRQADPALRNGIYIRSPDLTNAAALTANDIIKADIFGYTAVGSGELAWHAQPWVDDSFFGTETAGGNTTMGLNSAIAGPKKQTVSLPYAANMPDMNLRINGASAAAAIAIGARYVLANPKGVVIQPFAAAGYSSASLVANHANCGPVLKILGADAYICHFDVNDATLDFTPTQYGNNIRALIAFTRAAHGDSSMPFALMNGVYSSALSAPRRTLVDNYSSALKEIADQDGSVIVLNTRYLTETRGWNAGGSATFLSDGTHDTNEGGRAKAQATFHSLLAA